MIADPKTGRHIRILDAHQHLSFRDGDEYDVTLGERVDLLDSFGIDHAVLLPPSGAQGLGAPSMTAVNDFVARTVEQAPERFVAGVAHIALSEGEEACAAELERAVNDLGMRGAVWHHRFQGVHLDHGLMPNLLHQCADLGVPALIHLMAGSSLEATWRLENLLEECPKTKVLALDAFSSFDRAGEVTLLARKYPNLYCDLGCMPSTMAIPIMTYLEIIGAQRLVLGTDLYMTPQTWFFPSPVYEILHLNLTDKVKDAVLSGNAFELFSIDKSRIS